MRNRTLIIGDNLPVLADLPPSRFDFIYLDPPFFSGRDFGYFDDRWPSFGDYRRWVEDRIVACVRVLADGGYLYLHTDPRTSHYFKVFLDDLLGRDWFRNEIVWCYPPTGAYPGRAFHRKHDTILGYANPSGTWNRPYLPPTEVMLSRYGKKPDEDGRRYRIVHGKKDFLDDLRGYPIPDWWVDIPSFVSGSRKEHVGYPTQKPEGLIARLISAATDEGDWVLDPMVGSGTCAVAAERLNRRWVGIDANPKVADIIRRRISDQFGMFAPNLEVLLR